jgi:hypothetical protein
MLPISNSVAARKKKSDRPENYANRPRDATLLQRTIPADFARLVQADPNAWFMIISQAQIHASASQHYRTARDKAREKTKIASDECQSKQIIIDDLDARVADLETQLDRAKQKEDELVLAEEAIAAAKKHLESQRTQISELRTKLSEAGPKTPLTEEKHSNRFLDELGLLEPIETEDTDEGRKVPGSRAPSADRSLSADRSALSHSVLRTCLGERLPPGVGYNDRFPGPEPFSGKKLALAPTHYANTEEPKWSPGWLNGFKARFGIEFRAHWQHGELGSALLLDVELEIVRMSISFNPFANISFIRPPS